MKIHYEAEKISYERQLYIFWITAKIDFEILSNNIVALNTSILFS